MRIIKVVIEGFKCYRVRTEVDALCPGHNVVVGANGSGKSNFFAAIQFVLGELQGGSLRAEERKQLLHEGTGQQVSSARVEIHFDNRDGRLHSEHKEVVLVRSIGLKKDEYYLDRKHVTKNEVINLLESAGLQLSCSYFIVPQGKVNQLATMKEKQRLDMVKEVAGTRMYEERRLESVGILQETTRSKGKIAEMLSRIEGRLGTLNAEKEELTNFYRRTPPSSTPSQIPLSIAHCIALHPNSSHPIPSHPALAQSNPIPSTRLEKRRKVVEYTYYRLNCTKAQAELSKLEASRAEEEACAPACGCAPSPCTSPSHSPASHIPVPLPLNPSSTPAPSPSLHLSSNPNQARKGEGGHAALLAAKAAAHEVAERMSNLDLELQALLTNDSLLITHY